MHAFKSLLLAILSLSATTFAAPIDSTTQITADTATTTDGCNDAYRGDHRACEGGRDQKHDGYREEHRGEREIQNGNLGKGLGDILKGYGDQQAGRGRECRNGGHC